MAQQLSLAARPKSLDAMIGAEKITKTIRGHMTSGRVIKSWLFCGRTGSGKTTIARVLALSLQCKHQSVFGKPCKECWQAYSNFPIMEINASKLTGKDDINAALAGSEYGVPGDASYRVYILDECHRVSAQAQDSLLKQLEDSPASTIYILCSTSPDKIIRTIQSRCQIHELRELEYSDVQLLVDRLLKFAKSNLPSDRLVEALTERQVRLPRFIAQAVEKYVAGAEPDDAVQVEGSTIVDTKAMCRSAIRGDWPGVCRALQLAQDSDIKLIRASVIGYLKAILLESPDIATRTDAIAKSISVLCNTGNVDDLILFASLSAELYQVCKVFSKFKLG